MIIYLVLAEPFHDNSLPASARLTLKAAIQDVRNDIACSKRPNSQIEDYSIWKIDTDSYHSPEEVEFEVE